MTQQRSKISTGRSGARRDQLVALSLSAACMAAIFILQPTLTRMRVGDLDAQGNRTGGMVIENNSSVAQLAVETPRLVLGGFRGVLAMDLWQRAEDDKNERRWEALGTKYNIIGKLEPYFTSVYVFNSWNLAFNLSAQWHDTPNKYKWVLDGLDHLYLGEKYNPDDPDLAYQEAQMYFMKIGDSYEKIDYRQYWRDDIAHQYLIPAVTTADEDAFESHRKMARYLAMPQFKASLLESPSDASKKGYGIKIQLATKKAPTRTLENRHTYYGLRRISPEDADKLEAKQFDYTPEAKLDPRWSDDYLPQLERAFVDQQNKEKPDATMDFRYGVSVYYFAYVEFERCMVQSKYPSTTGPQVVDSRPGMSFRMWVRDDAYFATARIKEIFLENKFQDYDNKVLEIRDCFRNIRLVAQPNAIEEFELHLQDKDLFDTETIHRKHIYETNYMAAIARAESEMFEGLVAWRGDLAESPNLPPPPRPACANPFSCFRRRNVKLANTSAASMGSAPMAPTLRIAATSPSSARPARRESTAFRPSWPPRTKPPENSVFWPPRRSNADRWRNAWVAPSRFLEVRRASTYTVCSCAQPGFSRPTLCVMQ